MLTAKKIKFFFLLTIAGGVVLSCGKNVDQLVGDNLTATQNSTSSNPPAPSVSTYSWIGALTAGTVTNGWSTNNVAAVAVANKDGGFNAAVVGLAVDSTNGYFYTLDATNDKLSKFNLSTGAFVGAIGYLTANPSACPTQPNGTTTSWCTNGTFSNGTAAGRVDGNMGWAKDLAVDPTLDALYVLDGQVGKVSKFVLSTGTYVGSVGGIINNGVADTHGGAGTAANCPAATGTLTALTSWCKNGKFANNNIDGAYGANLESVDVDTTTHIIYIGDGTTHRVIKIDQNGTFVGALGSLSANAGSCPTVSVSGQNIASGWCAGGIFQSSSVDGGFQDAMVKIDSTHNLLYVLDGTSSRLSKFTLSTGAYLGSIGHTSSNANSCSTQGDGETTNGWCTGATYSPNVRGDWTEKDGAYDGFSRIALDSSYLYVTSNNSYRIDKINASTGVFVGAQGNVTTAGAGTCTVGVTTTWCTDGTFGAGTFLPGMFQYPQSIVMGADGSLYIADHDNARIVKMVQ